MSTLMESLGGIAGLSGLAIGLVLIIFRDIVRKNIFPRLDRNQSFKLILAIALLTWSISIYAIYRATAGDVIDGPMAFSDHIKINKDRLYCSHGDVHNPNIDDYAIVKIGTWGCSQNTGEDTLEGRFIAHLYGTKIVKNIDFNDTLNGRYKCAELQAIKIKNIFQNKILELFNEKHKSDLVCGVFTDYFYYMKFDYVDYNGGTVKRYFKNTEIGESKEGIEEISIGKFIEETDPIIGTISSNGDNFDVNEDSINSAINLAILRIPADDDTPPIFDDEK